MHRLSGNKHWRAQAPTSAGCVPHTSFTLPHTSHFTLPHTSHVTGSHFSRLRSSSIEQQQEQVSSTDVDVSGLTRPGTSLPDPLVFDAGDPAAGVGPWSIPEVAEASTSATAAPPPGPHHARSAAGSSGGPVPARLAPQLSDDSDAALRSVNQSIIHSISQSVSKSVNQSVSQSINQCAPHRAAVESSLWGQGLATGSGASQRGGGGGGGGGGHPPRVIPSAMRARTGSGGGAGGATGSPANGSSGRSLLGWAPRVAYILNTHCNM
jgi:hypothetical protein